MNKSKIFLLISLFIGFSISLRLFRPGYFSMQDDIQIFRLQQLDSCLHDGQIPCRFIADGGFGYGYPLYNYYSPLPYLVAEAFHLTGLDYINSIKAVFIIPNLIRSVSTYLLGNFLFGPAGGLVSSVLYTLAPYQAVDGFVRGALGEYWALSFIPLVLFALLSKKSNLYIVSLLFLLLSHNLTALYAVPLVLIFSLLTKNINKNLILNSVLAFLMSSFFLLPALLEKNLVTVDTMTQGYFSYINHFTTISELFLSRFWGYGASLWGPQDDMSFQIGYLQWILPLVVVIYTFFNKKLSHRWLILSGFFIGLLALFLTHNKSTFIWQLLPFMAYYQFPWRFLGLAVFCFSLISGAFVLIAPLKRFSVFLTFIIIAAAYLLNFNYFKEDIWYQNLSDSQKLTTSEIIRQSGAGLKDYWPNYSIGFPDQFSSGVPSIESGEVSNLSFSKNSHQAKGSLDVISDYAVINLPMVYFPNWELKINNSLQDIKIEPQLGLIQLNLPTGNYAFELHLRNTPIRTIANSLSLLAISLFIIKVIREKHS